MIRRIAPALVAAAALVAVVVVLFGWGRNAGDQDDPADRLVETGVVVDVDAVSLTEVLGFTLRTSDGRSVDFAVGPLENPAQFPPGHLNAHLADGLPVRVTYRQSGADRVAIRLEDAPESP